MNLPARRRIAGIFIVPLIVLMSPTGPLGAKEKHLPLDLAAYHNNQGVTYLGRNDLDKAEVEFKTACEIDPLYPEARSNLGLVFKLKGQYALAEESLKKATSLKPGWATPPNILGTVYLAQGDTGKAITYFRKAISLDKKFADAYYNLGIAYITRANTSKNPKPDWKEAVEILQEATTIDSRLFHAHLDLADTYRKLGELEKAILRYRLAIETNPKDPTAWQHLGELYMASNDPEKARDCFTKAQALGPMTEENLIKLAESSLAQKKSADAIGFLQRALEKNPNNPVAHFDMGFAYALQGQYAPAIRAYQMATRLKPDFVAAHFNMGIAYKTAGDLRDAVGAFQNALRYDPQHAPSLFETAEALKQAANPNGAHLFYCRFLKAAGKGYEEEKKTAQAQTRAMGGCR